LVPGPSQRVLERVNGGFVFSPDGRRIAFTRGLNPGQQLLLADSDGSNEQVLARQPPEAVFRKLAWSPDGRLIAVVTSADKEPGQTRWRLTAFRVADGAEEKFSAQAWNFIRTLVWLPDGSGLVLSARDRPDANEQLVLVPYPTGPALRITPELFSFGGVSITADGSKLVTNQNDRPANIWVVPVSTPDRATKVTQVAGPYGAVNWTPDGHIVYRTAAGTRSGDVSVMNADGSNNRQVGFGVSDQDSLAVAPDGRYIVLSSARAGGFNLWRMNLDGGDLRQLTTGTRDTCR
jgi:Tol biopolymer transport system component